MAITIDVRLMQESAHYGTHCRYKSRTSRGEESGLRNGEREGYGELAWCLIVRIGVGVDGVTDDDTWKKGGRM